MADKEDIGMIHVPDQGHWFLSALDNDDLVNDVVVQPALEMSSNRAGTYRRIQ
jgi:hypothetical protein